MATLTLAACTGTAGASHAAAPRASVPAWVGGPARGTVATTGYRTTGITRPAQGSLLGVSCPSATSCLAVGDTTPNHPNARSSPLAQRWNGTRWTAVSP